jgi:hypothetical protein
MPLILHVLMKDVRHLWWAIALTLVLQTGLARMDRWRADWLASPAEGWLNLLVPLAWACLIALAVDEEPLVGERHFWITWPYPWRALLASKVLFVLIFIHISSFVSDAAILTLRGFPPLLHLPQLLWKQTVLACALTIPAMALATLCKNIAHFLLAAIAMVGAAAYLTGMAEHNHAPWLSADPIRSGISILVLLACAAIVIPIQYARRRTIPSRMVGIAAAIVAALLFGLLPPTSSARVQATLHPTHADISLRLSQESREAPAGLADRNGTTAVKIALPIAISGVPQAAGARFAEPTVDIAGDITGPGGQLDRSDLMASLFPYVGEPAWLVLRVRSSAYKSIETGKVQIQGVSTVTLHRPGQTTWLRVGETVAVPGAGRCSSTVIESPSLYQGSLLKVLCESPSELSPATTVRLWQADTGRDWSHHLGDSANYFSGPRQTWLSPLNRLQTFFQLVAESHTDLPGERWLVPRDALRNSKLAITPDFITGWSVVKFEMRDVNLRDYLLKPAR